MSYQITKERNQKRILKSGQVKMFNINDRFYYDYEYKNCPTHEPWKIVALEDNHAVAVRWSKDYKGDPIFTSTIVTDSSKIIKIHGYDSFNMVIKHPETEIDCGEICITLYDNKIKSVVIC